MRFYGLEVNAAWAVAILDGKKTVELRSWELPPDAVGTARIALIVPSTPGVPGAPALTSLDFDGGTAATVAGWAVFGPPFRYASAAALAADEARHRVPAGSPFLAGGDVSRLWGWPVLAVGRAPEPHVRPPGGERVLRSLWALEAPAWGQEGEGRG